MPTGAVASLTDGRRRCVVFEIDGHAQAPREYVGDGDVLPPRECLGIYDVRDDAAAGDVERARQADPHSPDLIEAKTLRLHQFARRLFDQIHRLVRQREIQLHVHPPADRPDEIDEHSGEMILIQIETDAKGTIRTQCEKHGRRSAALLLAASLLDEPTLDEFPRDVGNGLRRQLRPPGDVGPRKRAVQTNRFQHDPHVVGLGELQIGSDQHGWWTDSESPVRTAMSKVNSVGREDYNLVLTNINRFD